MSWTIWPLRPAVQLRLKLGYSHSSWVRCMNLLIENQIRVLKMKADEERTHLSGGPADIRIIVCNPGKKKLRRIITALDRASFGCYEDDVSPFRGE